MLGRSSNRTPAIGVTDTALARYIVNRASGVGHNDALFQLLHPLDKDMKEANFVGAIVERFPVAN